MLPAVTWTKPWKSLPSMTAPLVPNVWSPPTTLSLVPGVTPVLAAVGGPPGAGRVVGVGLGFVVVVVVVVVVVTGSLVVVVGASDGDVAGAVGRPATAPGPHAASVIAAIVAIRAERKRAPTRNGYKSNPV